MIKANSAWDSLTVGDYGLICITVEWWMLERYQQESKIYFPWPGIVLCHLPVGQYFQWSPVSSSSLYAVLIVVLTLYLCNKTNIHTEYNTRHWNTDNTSSNVDSQTNNIFHPRIEFEIFINVRKSFPFSLMDNCNFRNPKCQESLCEWELIKTNIFSDWLTERCKVFLVGIVVIRVFRVLYSSLV